jgi:thiol:disulfide interchange protein
MTETSSNPTAPLNYRSPGPVERASASGIAAALIAIVTGFILAFMSCGLIVGMMVAIANRAEIRDVLGIAVLLFAAVLLLAGLVYLILGLKWLSRAARGHG